MQAYHLGAQPRKHLLGSQADQEARGEMAGQVPVLLPKASIREFWRRGRVRWGERLELLLGHSVSQWGANSICAGTFFIVRDITEGLVAWSLCSKCQQPPLLCPSYCDNEEQP